MTTIRDRSGESFGGSVQRHGVDHLRTSDAPVAAAPGLITGEGEIQGDPRVPSYKPYTEVAEVEGGGECCSAITAGEGGEAGPGQVTQGDPVGKSASSPVTAHVSQGEMVKTVSVMSHPQLASAHRHGSITKKDHDAVHQSPVVATPGGQSPVRSR
jgi:hypothetical protein